MEIQNLVLPQELPSIGSLLYVFSYMDYFHRQWVLFRSLSKTCNQLCNDKFILFRKLSVCAQKTFNFNSGQAVRAFKKYIDCYDLFEINLKLNACYSQILQAFKPKYA